MPTWFETLVDLPLRVESTTSRQRRLELPRFTRVSTEFELRGAGHSGHGEDVTYTADDHGPLPELVAALEPRLQGTWTLGSFSALLDTLDLFPVALQHSDDQRSYRRWAFESAALDLALRQSATSLPSALGIAVQPVRFVLSCAADQVGRWLEHDAGSEFKLDAGRDWDSALIERLQGTGAVRVIDLKAHYRGDWIDNTPDPDLYRAIAVAFPDAFIEDAWVDDTTRPALGDGLRRLSWDAPIHGIADIEAPPEQPAAINIKPSRFGTVRDLLETIEWCRERGVALYGGGQFELGVGRGQIQLLASLFYADAPNDVAPAVFHSAAPGSDVPRSPLPVPAIEGFRWS